ncbi:hypothetical protein PoB_007393900 [Plakobranchus ocellatus]|uniref:Uncharacterized protein n=1 Tax=Plakobranchus ocellatus TaxID=259542 RepID=A0AAV4DTE2_9GAST|nr:hypothetical protein PoB_007393900 [Plakobranchus ocellatus]
MVLSKASAWYHTVVRPLRRLSSPTANVLSAGQKHPPRPPSPAKSLPGEERNPVSPSGQEFHSAFIPEQQFFQQKQQPQRNGWNAFTNNPLDVILKDSSVPGHPVNLISQRINKPFSTSVVDQARGTRSEKKSPRPLAESSDARYRRVRKEFQVPKPVSARSKEVGSKKYRKYFRDKVTRKGPRVNARRNNPFLIKPCFEDSMVTPSEGISESLEDVKIKAGRMQILQCSQDKIHSTVGSSLKQGEAFQLQVDNLSDAPRIHSTNASACDPQNEEPRSSNEMPRERSMSSRCDGSTATVTCAASSSSATRQDLSQGSSKKGIMATIRDNLQNAAHGFKCSLWRRALAGDTTFQSPLRLAHASPCYISVKT